jgi:hypothetical protein
VVVGVSRAGRGKIILAGEQDLRAAPDHGVGEDLASPGHGVAHQAESTLPPPSSEQDEAVTR